MRDKGISLVKTLVAGARILRALPAKGHPAVGQGALGDGAVLIARPFVTAVYGGAGEGVQAYIDKIGAELSDTMTMCGAANLKEITRDMVWRA